MERIESFKSNQIYFDQKNVNDSESKDCVVEFDSLKLGDVEWRYLKTVKSDGERYSVEIFKNKSVIEYDGQEFDFMAKKKVYKNTMKEPIDSTAYENFEFKIRSNNRSASVNLDVNFSYYYRDNGNLVVIPSVETKIDKDDRERIMPRGLGMKLYEKMFEMIQEKANEDRMEYKHTVLRTPEISSEKPMTKKRWNEIFLPTLKGNGYIKIDNDEYSKVYKPANKIMQ